MSTDENRRWILTAVMPSDAKDAYRHAAEVHRGAERTEEAAASFFAEHGDTEAALRHAGNAARQSELADADDARAAACAGATTERV